jgi:uncharacterized protein with HEPN domain
MSKVKLEFVLSMIDDIEYILSKTNSITEALNDRIYKPAILMSLLQIGETLNKVETTNTKLLEYIRGAYNVRNFIAHDYEGVNLSIIEHILRELLQPLKDEIQIELEKF